MKVESLQKEAEKALERIRKDAITSIKKGGNAEKAVEVQIRESKRVYDDFFRKAKEML